MDMMMKKNKQHDWTDALRDRLQDARLPLEDGWAAGVDPEIPGNPVRPAPETGGRTGKGGISWPTAALWPWALAGVAAVLAAVLLLRPVREPVPSLLTQNQPSTAPAQTLSEPSGPDAAQFQPDPAPERSAVPARPSSKTASGAESRPHYPAASSKTAGFEDKSEKNTLPSSNQAQNEDAAGAGVSTTEIPGQAGNEVKGARNDQQNRTDVQGLRTGEAGTLTDIAQADLPPEPEELRKARRGPVSLRLQASVGGQGSPGLLAQANTNAAFYGAVASAQDAYHGEYIVMDALVSSVTDNPAPSDLQNQNGINTTQLYFLNQAAAQQARPFPISIGVSAALPLSRSWTLTAGLDYTQRSGTRAVTRTQTSNGFSYNEMSVDNVLLHYLGLPVDVHFYFNPDRRLRFYLGAGLKAEKCIYVKGAAPLADPILLSGSLQAGADFRLVPGVRLYLAPSVVQYFNQSSYYAFWDDRPSFVLRAGLAFDLKQK